MQSRNTSLGSAALAWIFLFSFASAIDPRCFGVLNNPNGNEVITCDPSGTPEKCFLLCGVCTTPELAISLYGSPAAKYCQNAPSDDISLNVSVTALLNASSLQGHYWNDGGGPEDNYTQCYSFLFDHMPRRDLIRLFAQPLTMLDFLAEHVRYALQARRQNAWAAAVPWDTFLDAVLPYTVVNEKHDIWWRWRPRFYQLFAPLVASATNVTDAVRTLVDAIPTAQALGTLAIASADGTTLNSGPPVTWVSESSPGILSPEQVVQHGGSCTGTGIVLAAACRAVGIPARLTGCSESVVANDDHHWVEFWDDTAPGPFGDYWHTKEGVSAGNTGGPWDSLSGPMIGCLEGVAAGDRLHTIWASSWSSPIYMPLLWSADTWSETWTRVGGVNRCGAYCTAWGCGPNRTNFYDQQQCNPTSSSSSKR